jgi:hypothetical protein
MVADRTPHITGQTASRQITAVGSIKWHDEAPFDGRDLTRLAQHRDRLPGTHPDTPRIAVSRTGGSVDGLPTITPDELITAWPS